MNRVIGIIFAIVAAQLAGAEATAGGCCPPGVASPSQGAIDPRAADTQGNPAAAVVNSVLGQYGKIQAALAEQARSVAEAGDIAGAREAFKRLSRSLAQFLITQKVRTGRHYQMYCSMANAGWIQDGQGVKNPYHGKSMLTCGEIVGQY